MRGSLSKGTLSWSLSKGTLSRSLSKGTLSWSLKLTHSMVGQQETPSTVKGYSCQPQRPLPEGAKHDQSGCQQSVPFHDRSTGDPFYSQRLQLPAPKTLPEGAKHD